jgi:peptidoglycan/LPS O-acetylase OafA/YrhL
MESFEDASNRAGANCFDVCRFGLAALVILSHSYAVLGNPIAYTEPLARLSLQIGLGTLAVNGFFVISGFLVSSSYCRCPSLGTYLRNRALRIYPGLLVALAISAWVVAPLAGGHGDFNRFIWRPLLGRNLPEYPGAFGANPLPYINGSLWTMRFEVFCYLLVPALAWLGCFQVARRSVVLFLVSYLGFQATGTYLKAGGHFQLGFFDWLDEMPHLVTYFLAGVTLYVHRARLPRSPRLAWAAMILGCLTIRYGLEWTLPFTWSYLILFVALGALPTRFYSLRWLGDISYGMYLYSFAIQQMLVAAWLGHWSPKRLFLASFPLSLIAGALSWHFVEQPCIRWKRASVSQKQRFEERA